MPAAGHRPPQPAASRASQQYRAIGHGRSGRKGPEWRFHPGGMSRSWGIGALGPHRPWKRAIWARVAEPSRGPVR